MSKVIVAVLLAALAIATSAFAEEKSPTADLQALQKAVEADKRGYVTQLLKLTDRESRKFWPLYDAYQRELDASNRRRVVVVERLIALDKPLSDLYAKNLAAELLAADDAELKARRTLQNRLMRALPPKKVARYLQLESKLRALDAYNIAAYIPFVD